jgi:hypothetical protein
MIISSDTFCSSSLAVELVVEVEVAMLDVLILVSFFLTNRVCLLAGEYISPPN